MTGSLVSSATLGLRPAGLSPGPLEWEEDPACPAGEEPACPDLPLPRHWALFSCGSEQGHRAPAPVDSSTGLAKQHRSDHVSGPLRDSGEQLAPGWTGREVQVQLLCSFHGTEVFSNPPIPTALEKQFPGLQGPRLQGLFTEGGQDTCRQVTAARSPAAPVPQGGEGRGWSTL